MIYELIYEPSLKRIDAAIVGLNKRKKPFDSTCSSKITCIFNKAIWYIL